MTGSPSDARWSANATESSTDATDQTDGATGATPDDEDPAAGAETAGGATPATEPGADGDEGVSLTRRGWAVAGIALAIVVLGGVFGDRGGTLNALVAPAVLGLAAGLVSVWRAGRPTVERTLPPDGFPGDVGEVELHVSGNRAGTFTVVDAVPPGLSAAGATHEVAGEETTVTHRLGYDRRGAHEVGPVTVTVTDLLGLATRTFAYPDATETLLVYPRLVEPPEHVLSSLQAVVELQRRPGRDEFDRLREYDRGDAPRDIHWKSSAKRPDDELVVKEFLGRTPSEGVGIAVGGSGATPTVDALAEAAASVAIHLLEEGVEVGLETPHASLESGVGVHQRESVLAMLARLSSGDPPRPNDAQVRISPDDGRAMLAVGGRIVPFHGPERGRRGGRQADEDEVVA